MTVEKVLWSAACTGCEAARTEPHYFPTQEDQYGWIRLHIDSTGHRTFFLGVSQTQVLTFSITEDN